MASLFGPGCRKQESNEPAQEAQAREKLRTEKQLCGMGIHEQMSLRQCSKTRVELKSSLTVGILFYKGPTSYLEILGSIEEFLKIPFYSI